MGFLPTSGDDNMQLPPQLMQYLDTASDLMQQEAGFQQNINRLRNDYFGTTPGLQAKNPFIGKMLSMYGADQPGTKAPVAIQDMPEFAPFFKSAYTPGGIQEQATRNAFNQTEGDILANLPQGGAQQELLTSNMRERNQSLAQIPAMAKAQNIGMEQQIANMLISGTPLNQGFLQMGNMLGGQLVGSGMTQAAGNQVASQANDMAMWNVAKNSIPGGKK